MVSSSRTQVRIFTTQTWTRDLCSRTWLQFNMTKNLILIISQQFSTANLADLILFTLFDLSDVQNLYRLTFVRLWTLNFSCIRTKLKTFTESLWTWTGTRTWMLRTSTWTRAPRTWTRTQTQDQWTQTWTWLHHCLFAFYSWRRTGHPQPIISCNIHFIFLSLSKIFSMCFSVFPSRRACGVYHKDCLVMLLVDLQSAQLIQCHFQCIIPNSIWSYLACSWLRQAMQQF